MKESVNLIAKDFNYFQHDPKIKFHLHHLSSYEKIIKHFIIFKIRHVCKVIS